MGDLPDGRYGEMASWRGLVADGTAGTSQRHWLNVANVPLRLISDVFGSPTIEHRRDARGAFSTLRPDRLLDVLCLPGCRHDESFSNPQLALGS